MHRRRLLEQHISGLDAHKDTIAVALAAIVAVERVGLQNSGVVRQVRLGMLRVQLWRNGCNVTRLVRPAALTAERQATCNTVGSIGLSSSRPGNRKVLGRASLQWRGGRRSMWHRIRCFTASKPIARARWRYALRRRRRREGTLPSTAEPARTRACPACPSGLPEDAGVP